MTMTMTSTMWVTKSILTYDYEEGEVEDSQTGIENYGMALMNC